MSLSKMTKFEFSDDEDFNLVPLRCRYRVPEPLPLEWTGWSSDDEIPTKLNSSGNDLILEPGQSLKKALPKEVEVEIHHGRRTYDHETDEEMLLNTKFVKKMENKKALEGFGVSIYIYIYCKIVAIT